MKKRFKALFCIGSVIVIISMILVACLPQWRGTLSWHTQAKWSRHDRLAFLIKSPWSKFSRAEVNGFEGDAKVYLDVQASWLSSYFEGTRSEVIKAARNELPRILKFDPHLKKDKFIHADKLTVAGDKPFPLTNTTVVSSPVFKSESGFWPTGVEAAQMAYRSLNIMPPEKSVIQFDLDSHYSSNEYIMIELSIVPVIENAESKQQLIAINECLGSVLGQLVMQGGTLERGDKDTVNSVKTVVLSGDINGLWNKYAFGQADIEQVIIVPRVVKVFFPKEKKGAVWLRENERKVKLTFSLPDNSTYQCSLNTTKKISVNLTFEYDLVDMKVVGPLGV